jgi:hypothetical protein
MQRSITLQPKQVELGKLMYSTGPDAPTWIGGGGARAGGKSGGLRRIMLDRRQQRPGTNGAIIRRVYEEVKKNHIDMYMAEFPELRQYYHVGDKEFVLPNGSKIMFMYAENQQEVDRKFWGIELYDIFVDQAEQFSEYELQIIHSCNRWPGTPLGECKTGLFFNPGGVGTEFLRRVFAQRRFSENERGSDYAFVHLFGWDNFVWFNGLRLKPKEFYALPSEERFDLFINQTAEGRKLNALPASLRAGHLLGSFDSFAGQYFAGVWDESKLILTAQQEEALIQPWWNRWMSHDDGFVHHASVSWWASGKVSPKLFHSVFGVEIPESVEVVVVYRNHAEQEVEQGELIRKCVAQMPAHELKTIKRYFLSVDAWEKDSKGHATKDTINEELRRAGLPWAEQADNGRIGGWRFLYAMMKKTGDVLSGRMNPTREDEDYEVEGGGYSLKTPLLFISGDCTDIIESIPMAIRDNKHPGRAEDVLKMPTKADDVLDDLRYGAKSMLNPRSQAPLEVRAKEFYGELTTDSQHSKWMAMQKWEHANKPKRVSPWSGRQ